MVKLQGLEHEQSEMTDYLRIINSHVSEFELKKVGFLWYQTPAMKRWNCSGTAQFFEGFDSKEIMTKVL
jgi:hypothetical protein